MADALARQPRTTEPPIANIGCEDRGPAGDDRELRLREEARLEAAVSCGCEPPITAPANDKRWSRLSAPQVAARPPTPGRGRESKMGPISRLSA